MTNSETMPGIEVIGVLENSGTHHINIFDISRFRVRKLTPTEYGRLQAFPVDDGWEQVVSNSQAYRQFGNAVTVSVVEAIGRAIGEYLDSIFSEDDKCIANLKS